VVTVAKLIDTTTCIGCKACEAACVEWQDQPLPVATYDGTYQTFPDLRHDFWNVIKFNEIEHADGGLSWHMAKFQCMHCVDAGCITACPAPGAIFRHDNGTVDFDHDKCIGCGYCITGCPFDVPRLSPITEKVYKCNLCSDRTAVGLEPACIKACPTNCLTFGARDDLVEIAHERAETLRENGSAAAGVYNPAGVGGTNVIYVLADAAHPEDYGLPNDPTVPWAVRVWQGPLKWLGNAVLIGGILGTFLHYLRFGPRRPPGEAEAETESVS